MKKALSYIIALLALSSITSQGFSQSVKIDSLRSLLSKATIDSSQIRLNIQLGKEFVNFSSDSSITRYNNAIAISEKVAPLKQLNNSNVSKETTIYFGLKSQAFEHLGDIYTNAGNYQLAIDNFSRALAIEKWLNNPKRQVAILSQIGITYFYLGNFDVAIERFEEMLAINQKIDDKLGIAQSYNNIGIIYRNQGYYDKALECYMNSLKIYEKLEFKPGMAKTYNNIGIIHWSQENFSSAIEYYQKALEINNQTNNKKGIAQCLNNIGIIYDDQKIFDKAIDYYQQAQKIHKELGDKQGILATYNNLGVIYKTQADKTTNAVDREVRCDIAIENFKKSLKLAQELGDKSSITMIYGNLASLNLLLSEINSKQKHLKKALEYGHLSYNLAIEIGSIPYQNDAASHLNNAYYGLGNIDKAYKYSNIYIKTRQDLFNVEKTNAVANAEAKFNAEKKQQEIDKKTILLSNQILETSKQRTIRNAIIIALFMAMLLFAIAYKGYAEKKSKNLVIEEKNAILEQANAEILAQRDELEAQRDMLVDHNQKMEEAHNHITDSLHYAQSIQAAILPSEKVLEGISPDYFVFMKPFQVVSGDFFWAVSIEEFRIFGVADCTGHGVPGAFMSILGLNALNDVVVRHRMVKPNQILGFLRESVINALGQNDPDQTHKDGMDMALCVFNTKTRELQYSGARIPLWIVTEEFSGFLDLNVKKTKSTVSQNNHTLYEIKADIMPVGIAPRMNPFSVSTFSLKGCSASIYLATDGFADQFGGSENGKYGAAKLKKLLLDNVHKPFPKQKAAIQKEFEKWSGSGNQVDDVTILGIRI